MICISAGGHSAHKVETKTDTFRVTPGAAEAIYQEMTSGAQLSLSTPQGYPIQGPSSVTGQNRSW